MANNRDDSTAHALSRIALELCRVATAYEQDLQWKRSHCGFATKEDLENWRKTMQAEYVELFTELAEHRKKDKESVDNLQGDFKRLEDRITALETTIVGLTPEEKAAVAAARSESKAFSESLDALAKQREEAPEIPEVPPEGATTDPS